MDVLGAASAPREHTPTERMFWGANRKGELGKRLQREVKTHTCTSSLTAQKKMGIKMGMLDDDAELSRPHGWQNRRAHHRKALRRPG